MNEKFEGNQKTLTSNVKAGGCAAKMGASELRSLLDKVPVGKDPNLLAGIGNFEDAAVYKVSEDLAIIETIDFFPPLVDDPYLFGQIAATNALSDVYAMGGRPIVALNVLCFPTCDFPEDVLQQILMGGAKQVAASGAVLAGGHSIQLNEPVYGLSVTGLVDPRKILTNSGAKSGDILLLTKPIGTGVALLGMKGGVLSEKSVNILVNNLTMLNEKPLRVSREYQVNALTDITGFGLIGHLHEMAKASSLNVKLNLADVPLLPETRRLASEGFVPAGAYGNRKSFEEFVLKDQDEEPPLELEDLLYDPQTSGGLLFSLPEEDAHKFQLALSDVDIDAALIGQFFEPEDSEQSGFVRLNSKSKQDTKEKDKS